MSEVEKKREKLINSIEKLTIALDEAKSKYKAFCQEHPYAPPKQPTIHELRMMREKCGEAKSEEHDTATTSVTSDPDAFVTAALTADLSAPVTGYDNDFISGAVGLATVEHNDTAAHDEQS